MVLRHTIMGCSMLMLQLLENCLSAGGENSIMPSSASSGERGPVVVYPGARKWVARAKVMAEMELSEWI